MRAEMRFARGYFTTAKLSLQTLRVIQKIANLKMIKL
jgi:hypothetical protein